MRLIFITITLLLLVPISIAWKFQDFPMFVALSVIEAFVVISSFFVEESL